MNKCFKYYLYPNKEQEILLQKTFGSCRFIYNRMLSDKIAYYQETGQVLKNTPAQYKREFVWLKEVDSLALANEQMHLQSAYKNFFSNVKSGFPKFKSKKFDKKSYTTNCINNSIRIISHNHMQLPKLGIIRFVEHRSIPNNYSIKSATISQSSSGKYYISILTEYSYTIPKRTLDINKAIGLDYSAPEFYVDNQNNRPEVFMKLFKKSQPKLAKEQRKLSHMKLNSNNYEKQRRRIARIHEHIANQRKDFIEKESKKLADKYDVVCVEDIDMKAQSQALKLGKSTMDNAFGYFRTRLQQKLEYQGKRLMKIGRFTPSSIVCSTCGCYHKDIVNGLSVREWVCPDCRTIHKRDQNAAKNILHEGLRLLT